MPSYTPVAAVLRGLEILRLVSHLKVASVSQLHQETGFDKATIIRMLETLIHAGYVSRDSATGGYRITGRTLRLSAGFDMLEKAADLADPILSRFRAKVGWPSDFALRDGDAMIVAGTTRDPGPLAFNRQPGFRAPFLQTSIGRAYLAYCDKDERNAILKLVRTGKSPSAAEIDRMLEDVRKDGFATMDDEYSAREYNNTMWAIAVPVMDDQRVYGAINMMLLRQAVSREQARTQYLPSLKEVADEVARAFHAGGL